MPRLWLIWKSSAPRQACRPPSRPISVRGFENWAALDPEASTTAAFPWWVFAQTGASLVRRPSDYLALAKLLRARPHQTVSDVIGSDGVLYERLWKPVLLSALNTDPAEGSARLAGRSSRKPGQGRQGLPAPDSRRRSRQQLSSTPRSPTSKPRARRPLRSPAAPHHIGQRSRRGLEFGRGTCARTGRPRHPRRPGACGGSAHSRHQVPDRVPGDRQRSLQDRRRRQSFLVSSAS